MTSANTSYHIYGHGLAGCILALTLYRHNISVTQSGISKPGAASMASSGLIAPVTGRRYVKAWNIDTYIPAALDFYRWTETLFGETYFHPLEIVRFLHDDMARAAWNKRLLDPEYSQYISQKTHPSLDIFNRPYGILTGAYRLDTARWLQAAHHFLENIGVLTIGEKQAGARETDITIWATGATDPEGMPFVIPNKGEALLVRMPAWSIPIAIKDDVFILPVGDDLYWVGSYYDPWPEHHQKTEAGKARILDALSSWGITELAIIDHKAGTRPTVDDRRPLIGAHPSRKGEYMFNGMGTKGTSLAPYWAEQLFHHLVAGLALPREVRPERFSKPTV